jgi:hypothetical protein
MIASFVTSPQTSMIRMLAVGNSTTKPANLFSPNDARCC